MRENGFFIPRKDSGPRVASNSQEDIQKAFDEQFTDTKANALAVQNYITQQPSSARAKGPQVDVAAPGPVYITKLPLDTVDYDITGNMVDLTNDRILLPEDGIYLVTGKVEGDVTGLAPGPGPVYVYIYANGLFSAHRQYEQWYDSAVFNGVDINFASQYFGSVRDYLEIWIQDLSLGTPGQFLAKVVEFSVTIVGRTPSVNQ